MRPMIRLGALALLGAGVAGCSQITVTSNTIVDGSAQLADATTNAVQGTSNVTTDTTNDIDARTHYARLKFVHSQFAMLKREASRGQGEDLDALAYMMSASDEQAFDAKVQANYQTLFSGTNNANEFLTRLYRVMGTPPDMQVASAAVAG